MTRPAVPIREMKQALAVVEAAVGPSSNSNVVGQRRSDSRPPPPREISVPGMMIPPSISSSNDVACLRLRSWHRIHMRHMVTTCGMRDVSTPAMKITSKCSTA